MKKLNEVDKYLSRLPKENRIALEKLRKLIKAIVPKAEECVSYQIPVYKYYGMLVGFAAFKNHLSFMVMSASLLKKMAKEVKQYSMTTSVIHFSADKPLPVSLVKKIVKIRMKENEGRRKK